MRSSPISRAPEIRGAAYGLRQSLDTVGAFIGPLLAIALMLLFAGDFRAVFWFAVIPGVLSVALLIFGVHEAERAQTAGAVRPPFHLGLVRALPAPYWWVVVAGGVFTLARFSEAFLLLRAQQQGLPDTYAPLVLVLMNVVFALSAYPMGRLADRMNPLGLLAAGLVVLVVADIALGMSSALATTAIGVALWGLHMGMTQGVLAAMVAGERAGGAARHRVRLLQSRERRGDARREHARGIPVGPLRRARDFLRGRGFASPHSFCLRDRSRRKTAWQKHAA